MRRPDVITKCAADLRLAPNFVDYEAARTAFSWPAAAAAALDGLPGGGLNIAWEAVGRHAAGPRRDRVALRFVGSDEVGGRLATHDISFAGLAQATRRFATVLRGLGCARGERLFVLAGRIPELYVAVLGGLHAGLVVAPLFAAFGPGPVATRIGRGGGRVLVTTESLYRRKVEPVRGELSGLRHVLLIGDDGGHTDVAGTHDLRRLLDAAADDAPVAPTGADDPALLHFTSGTTGAPKGAIHAHGAAVAHYVSARLALDLHDDDIYWCTADPGWVTGVSYGIVAPLLLGVTSVVDVADFDAARWYRILDEQRVSVWYTAPTAIRLLMKAGPQLAASRARPALRFVASVGEPLNAEAVWWGREVLGQPIHDTWWQTETGAIMIANTAAFDIRPGSMGRPLPGIEACLVRRRADGGVEVIDAPGEEGELALRRGWPSQFRGYLGDDMRTRKCFAGDLYLSGDLARRDADGLYWFVGRGDDVIKSAGHLIGPFEVESVLMEHPAVAEAAVIGLPDPVVGEVVKAFVTLKPGFAAAEALRRELLGHARKRLGAAVAPKAIEFQPLLPRTRSGKILRRLLKARELGLPEGDLSTLEGGG